MAFIKFIFLLLLLLPFGIFILYIVDKLMDECAVLKTENEEENYIDHRRNNKRKHILKRRKRKRKS